jgi:hypothetical protein
MFPDLSEEAQDVVVAALRESAGVKLALGTVQFGLPYGVSNAEWADVACSEALRILTAGGCHCGH